MSMSECSSDERPIFMTRLVDDSGGSMNGGLAQVGSAGVTWLTPLLDELPRDEQIGARLEDQHDRGQVLAPTSSA